MSDATERRGVWLVLIREAVLEIDRAVLVECGDRWRSRSRGSVCRQSFQETGVGRNSTMAGG